MKRFCFVFSYLFILLSILCTKHTSAQVLTIQPFSLYTHDGIKVMELQKDGLVHFFDDTVGRLLKNGQVENTDGELLASLDKNGLLKDVHQKLLGKLLADGSWDNGSGVLQASQDGIYHIREDLSLQLEPNDTSLYKTAGLLVVLTFYFNTVTDVPETTALSDPEIVLVLSQSPGGPGTQSYEYTVHADGKVSTPGYSHATTRYRITQEELANLLDAARDIDIATLAGNGKPHPFVHDGQVMTLKLRHNNTLYALYFGQEGDPMTREVYIYINYVRKFLAAALKRK